MTRSRILATLTLLAALGMTRPAAAFKIDTHVWIAQQVLNDLLDDCVLTIDPFGDFRVRDEVCDALAMHPEAYRMGSIGPDGFPDLAGGQMTTHPGLEAVGGWVTDDWLKWVISNAEEPDELAFALGYLTHAAGDTFAHTYVNTYAGDILELAGEQEVELRHMAIEEYMLRRQPPLVDRDGRPLVDHEIVDAPAEWITETLILAREARDQYELAGLPHLVGMRDFLFRLEEAVERLEAIQDEIEGALGQVQGWIGDLLDQIDAIKDREFELCTPRICLFGKCTPRVCVTVKLWPSYCVLDPAGCLAVKGLEAQLAATRALLQVPIEASRVLLESTLNPLVQWRNDVRRAIVEYTETLDEVMREIMKDHDDPLRNPLGPLKSWACRWGSAFAAVPGSVSTPVCGLLQVPEYIGRVKQGITDAEDFAAEKLGIFTWVVAPHIKIRQVKDEVFDAIGDEFRGFAQDLVAAVAGEDSLIFDVVTLRLSTEEQAENGTKLRNVYSQDNSGTGLLEIDDIVARVRHDMGLPPAGTGGQWSPDRYAVVHNAIVLSKLLLLDAAALNSMVRRASIGRTVYGPQLFEVDPARPFNIMFGAIRSIDGNQQWQERGIPYPRVAVPEELEPGERYGYAFREAPGKEGFRLWQDCEARTRVFMTIFDGPLAPGLESPPAGIGAILDPLDPNRASPDDPFPFAPEAEIPGKVASLEQEIEVGESQVVILDSPVCGGEVSGTAIHRWTFVEQCFYAWVPVQLTPDQVLVVYQAGICLPHGRPQLPRLQHGPIHPGALASLRHDEIIRGLLEDLGITTLDITQVAGVLYEVTIVDRRAALVEEQPGAIAADGNLLCNAFSPLPVLVKTDPIDLLVELLVLDRTVIFTGGRPIIAIEPVKTTLFHLTSAEPPRLTHYSDVAARFGLDLEGLCALEEIPAEREVEIPPDESPPVIAAPADIVATCGEEIALETPLASDDRDANVTVAGDSPGFFDLGTTIVTWTARDEAGNVARVEQRVTVLDLEPPLFLEPPDPLEPHPERLDVLATTPGLVDVSVPRLFARDACEGDVAVERSPAGDLFPIGETRVVWTARDSSGNEVRDEMLVVVRRLEGDVNVDGMVDASDLEFVLNAVGESAVTPELELRDYDGSGAIDESERELFAELLAGQRDPRDLDGDGLVTESDVALLRELCDDPACDPVVDPERRFRRGDVQADGSIDLSDAIFVFQYLFNGGPPPPCEKAADVNDSGDIDLSDGVWDLNFLFLGRQPPRPPYPECGTDPTPDELSCESFRPCD